MPIRTRIIAAIGALAVATGLIGAALVALSAIAGVAPVDDSGDYTLTSSQVRADDPAIPPAEPVAPARPEPLIQPALPTVADIPAGLSDDEYDHAIEWLTWSGLIDQCMADAGFPEWFYTAYWQTGAVTRWDVARADPDRRAEASFALGGNPGTGADYRWQDAGCNGAATETLGISS